MIISSWNVNSIRARIENIKDYIKKFSPEIILVQEIKTEDKTFPYDEIKSFNYESYVFGQKSYNGVAILSKLKLLVPYLLKKVMGMALTKIIMEIEVIRIAAGRPKLKAISKIISSKRQSVLPKLESKLEDLLHDLGMPNAKFKIDTSTDIWTLQ